MNQIREINFYVEKQRSQESLKTRRSAYKMTIPTFEANIVVDLEKHVSWPFLSWYIEETLTVSGSHMTSTGAPVWVLANISFVRIFDAKAL